MNVAKDKENKAYKRKYCNQSEFSLLLCKKKKKKKKERKKKKLEKSFETDRNFLHFLQQSEDTQINMEEEKKEEEEKKMERMKEIKRNKDRMKEERKSNLGRNYALETCIIFFVCYN